MRKNFFPGVLCSLVIACASIGPIAQANAQTLVESSAETRFQFDFHVSEAALAAYLPTGWTSNAATQGPAKDCNLRVVFIDRMTITGPDGRPLGAGSNRLVYLVAPVKDASGVSVQLVIGGLTQDPTDAPGPFGNYLLASTHEMQRTTTSNNGPVTESQDWVFAATSGQRLELHIKFEKGAGNTTKPSDTKFYSAKNPTFYQIANQAQNVDILRNTTTNPPDRVKSYSFKATGGSYAKLFNGAEKTLSWDNIVWINRSVSLP